VKKNTWRHSKYFCTFERNISGMKNIILLAALSLILSYNSSAQIICIYCYEQNDSISDFVTNFVQNGGFEDTVGNTSGSFCPNSSTYTLDFAYWTCTGGGSSTYAHSCNNGYSWIPQGALAAYMGNYFCRACSPAANDTTCINSTQCAVTGVPTGYPENPDTAYGGTTGLSLEQTVSGLIPGATYVLEFWAGGEYWGGYGNKGLFAVNVGFGNTFLRNKPTLPFGGIGTRFLIEFNATSSSHTIKFTNWGHICSTCTELILDDVRLYSENQLPKGIPDCSVGTNDSRNAFNMTDVFPNPFTNELNIKTNSSEVSEVILCDIASRTIARQKFTGLVSLNMEELAAGIYFYEVRTKNGMIKKGKVVKE
jgi:hypothetical protein